MSKGVVYIAFGDKFIKEAIFSATSLKFHCPNISITIFANVEINNSIFNNEILLDDNDKGDTNRCKMFVLHKSPYTKTLYIDTDTMINHDIEEVFEILDKFDIALVHDFARKRCVNFEHKKVPKGYEFSKLPEYNNIPYAFPEYNGGVILYKKSEQMDQFFSDWANKYNEIKMYTTYDQPSFRMTLWNSNLRIHTLPLEYNRRSKNIRDKNIKYRKEGIFSSDHLKTRIYHFHDLPMYKSIDSIENDAQII
jgi:hypothetical protein